ncbi:translocase of chloroplast 159, chloroplastic [Malania oleifera]|uniref:translocase of chloroplast 159, chloroplastic n=1 Tax=Malania oleifera TaxID=397392 RepID=UPI0025AE2B54|nr:translocase of chloroplast 159, chloroplastic [Malania oleifera]
MESKPAVPLSATEVTSFHRSNSSGSSPSSLSYPIRAPVSFDSDDENDVKTNDLKINGKTSSKGSVSSSSSEEGFVSGDEGFETASERPVVGDPDEETLEKAMDMEDIDSSFVESFMGSAPEALMPIAKVSSDDDGDSVVKSPKGGLSEGEEVEEDGDLVAKESSVVENPEIGAVVLGENANLGGVLDENAVGVTEETEVEALGDGDRDKALENLKKSIEGVNTEIEEVLVPEKPEVEGIELKDEGSLEEQKVEVSDGYMQPSEMVEGSSVTDDGTAEISSLSLEPADNKLVEVSGVNSENGGDSVVDAIHVDPLSSDVGDAEGSKDFEAEGMGVLVDGSVPLDNGFDKTSCDAEELLDSEHVEVHTGFEKSVQSASNFNVEAAAMAPCQEKADENFDGEAIVVNAVVKDDQTGVKMDACTDKDHSLVRAPGDDLEDGDSRNMQPLESAELSSMLNQELTLESEAKANHYPDEGDTEGSVTDGETEGMIFESSEAAKQFLEELERGTGTGSHTGVESYHEHSQRMDGQIVTDSDEEADTDEEGDGKELFDSNALAALLKAATSSTSDSGNITITSQDGARIFSLERPAGLGSSLQSLRPVSQPNRSNLFTSSNSNLMVGGEAENNLTEEEKKKLEKIQQIRVKFLRLVQRLGYSAEDSIAQQVLYRLALAAGRQTSQSFSVDAAKRTALQLEAEGNDNFNFSLNILVLGKSGVGKSATINSIFGEERSLVGTFEPATTAVKEIVGKAEGVEIRVFDSPGLRSSIMEQGFNRKVLSSIKKSTKSSPPDIVLYVDRMDTQTRDLNELPLLRTITSSLGSSIWRSAIVTLTHAASAPPDGPSGSPMSYEAFVAQRSHAVQRSIGQAVGDLRLMNPGLMNPVTLVENHPSCRKNREGQKVLPNGQCWRPQLLLLCYSMKILSEVSSLSKAQDPFDHRKLFGFRVRSPPLPYLLSWLLQSRSHPKLSADQGGENGDSDIDLDDLSDTEQEDDEDEYDQLPPFKPLKKSQIAKLSKEQRKAYFEEYDYRVKLLQKKQWREELRRMREMKKKGNNVVGADDYGYMGEDIDQENGGPAAVPVPLPDMVLPPSFDGDNPAYRYRFLEPTSQFLARPVLDTHGWDHDCGYDGVNLEQALAIVGRFPAAVAVQITKDKKEFNIHLDSSVSAKHGENGSSMVGFDIQNIGKQLAYILRGETKFNSWKKNKTAAGVSVTFLGENIAPGVKIEDQIALGKRLILVGSAGTVRSQGDAAYGANLEVRLREPDYPIGQDQSTLGLSLVKWRGDLALGANLQSQFSIGRSSKMAVRAALNNKLSGQISIRISSSEQLQIALMGILPVAMAIYKNIWPGVSENYSIY